MSAIIAERISARLWIEDLFSQSTYVCMCVRMRWGSGHETSPSRACSTAWFGNCFL